MSLDKVVDGMRVNRHTGERSIVVVTSKQFSELQRYKTLLIARELGYDDVLGSNARNLRVFEAAAKLVAFDDGLQTCPTGKTVKAWMDSWVEARCTGNIQVGLSKAKPGRKRGTYATQVEERYPGHLHRMYRLATKTEGTEATWKELAVAMNTHSQSVPEETLKMGSSTLRRWFRTNNGSLATVMTKPMITPQHMAHRVEYATQWKHKVDEAERTKKPLNMAFLDEKWFYTRSKRRKEKRLPRHSSEPLGADVNPTRVGTHERYW